MELKKKFIGSREFYKMVLIVAVPMIIQNGITNFVSMLDNIMVGQLGTESMSGVAIANQLIFVFNLCIFGGISGAGIFCAQFFGAKDHEGVKNAFRFKLIVCAVLCVIFITAFVFWDEQLISFYLHQSESSGDLALTLAEGQKYLRIMLLGLIPFAINNAYAGTLRETGETMVPMRAGVAAVAVNFTFNWLLIFGNMGFPRLGVEGAAIATVMSRFVETFIIVTWTHRHTERNVFAVGLYRHFSIPAALSAHIIRKGWPLLLNETLYSFGMTFITQCYSTRGLSAIAAYNISSTLSNLFKIVLYASGNSIAIIVGNRLGAGKMKEARDADNKLIAASVGLCVIIGGLLLLVAPLFPAIYNTTADVKELATIFLRISAVFLPVQAFTHACYFTLRAGGKTFITFLFDSVFIWCIILPPAFITSRFTAINVISIYAMVQALELVKAAFGFVLVKRGDWMANIVLPDSGK